jgi:hypothetical protein
VFYPLLAFWVLEARNSTDWWERGFFVVEDDKLGTGQEIM